MGTDGGLFDRDDQLSDTTRLNRKFFIQDTGANLTSLSPTYSGMIVFCTSTGGSFTAGRLYHRNNANSAWLEIATVSGVEVFTNKTISGASNTFQNIGTSSIVDTTIAAVKLGSTSVYGRVQLDTAFNTTSTTYVDVTSATVTVTATGNRAALMCEVTTDVHHSDGDGIVAAVAITDSSNNIQSAAPSVTSAGNEFDTYPLSSMSVSVGLTTAGSTTRKVRAKCDGVSQSIYLNDAIETAGISFYVHEII